MFQSVCSTCLKVCVSACIVSVCVNFFKVTSMLEQWTRQRCIGHHHIHNRFIGIHGSLSNGLNGVQLDSIVHM